MTLYQEEKEQNKMPYTLPGPYEERARKNTRVKTGRVQQIPTEKSNLRTRLSIVTRLWLFFYNN